jgi:cytochrome c-type biogenesis protein CcsB
MDINTEVLLHWLATTAYGLSSVGAIVGFVFKREKIIDTALWIGLLGLLPHTVAIGGRWLRVGHGPYINMYEVMSSDAWVAMVFYLLIQLRFKFLKKAAPVIMSLIFLSMGFGLMSTRDEIPLPPSLRSYWLVLHVIFAKLCSASLLVAFGCAGLYLYKNSRKEETGFTEKLPSLQRLDLLIYRFNALGFAFLTIMIIAGSIWANNAWGRYWAFDPVETWSLITWLAYGLFLHLRLNRQWTGRRSAYVTLFIFTLSVLSFFFIPYFLKTVHSEYLVR